MSLRYQLLCFIGRHELIFRATYGIRGRYRHLVVSRASDLVIEGFPRCANTFAVLAFERAQSCPLNVAHHLHAQAQIAMAIEWDVPILILIREPARAVASLITRHPHITIDQALRQYGQFYQYVHRHRDQLVIADFSEITTEFSAVISRLNNRFFANFGTYENSQEEDAVVFSEIDQLNREEENGNRMQLARPSLQKRVRNDEMIKRVRTHPEMSAMQALYHVLVP